LEKLANFKLVVNGYLTPSQNEPNEEDKLLIPNEEVKSEL